MGAVLSFHGVGKFPCAVFCLSRWEGPWAGEKPAPGPTAGHQKRKERYESMAKRGLSLLLALVTVFSLTAPAFAEEAPEITEATEVEPVTVAATSGKCGDNVTWSFAGDTLTISGTGPMADYDFGSTSWYDFREQIKQSVIESGVTSVGKCAFYNCTSLTSVTIPADVTSIGKSAFRYCRSLTGVTIPDSVTSIGEEAFSSCSSLTSIAIPRSVTSIGRDVFGGCTGLTSVAIPDSVTSIDGRAFQDCWSLTSLTIPNSVTSIESTAFQGCDGLTSITIPASVMNIGDGWAFNASNLTDIYVDSNNKNYVSVGGILFNLDKTKLVCYPQGRTAASYAIPNTVKLIDGGAFSNCDSLTSVAIPNSVTSIGWGAFSGCKSLTGVTIPGNVTSIENDAFSNCPSLTSVTLPGSVTSIGNEAFYNCTSLTSLTIENATCKIADYNDTVLGVPGTTVVRGYDGSTAQTYANKYGYKFESLGKAPGGTTPATPTTKPTVTPVPTLSVPTVTISQTSDGIKVSWNKITGSPRYMVYYKENGGIWTKIGTTTAISYTRRNSLLKNGATYQFAVRCCADDKETLLSGYKASNSLKYTIQQPAIKPSLTAPTVTISQTSDGIQVSWNKIPHSPRYMVYYKENGGIWTKIGTTTAINYTRRNSLLTNGATYQFAVRCCSNDKETLLSGYKASNSLKYIVNLAAPIVKISKVSDGIRVSWDKITGSPRYMVYYRENGGIWTKIGTTTAINYIRKNALLKNGATYQFAVRCCADDKETLLSGYKASNSLKYIVTLTAPTVKISQESDGILVSWNKIKGSPLYAVYYRENGGIWTKIGTTAEINYTRKNALLTNGATYQFTVRCCADDKTTWLSYYKASNSIKYQHQQNEYQSYRAMVDAVSAKVPVGEKQEGSNCTWASTATMLKRRQALEGKEITFSYSLVHSVNRRMVYAYKYTAPDGVVYETITETGNSIDAKLKDAGFTSREEYLVNLLQKHPEGIVIYCNYATVSGQHAIVLTDYTLDEDGTIQFYADDPQNNTKGAGRIPLESTYMYGKNNGVLKKFSRLWYVK